MKGNKERRVSYIQYNDETAPDLSAENFHCSMEIIVHCYVGSRN